MGRYKVVMTHREGKHKMTFIIDFSTKEDFQKEMQRILDEWIKKTGILNFTNTSITSACEKNEVNLKQAYGRAKNLKTETEDHDKLVEDKQNIEKIIKNCEDYFQGVLGNRDPEIDRMMRKDCAEWRAKLAEINKQLGEA